MANRLIADPAKPKAPLFIAEWDAPADYSFPQGLRVDDFDGLVLAGIVRYPAGVKPPTKVVTYWCCSSALDAQGADFRKAAGFKHPIAATVGVQGDVRERQRPQWKNPGFLFGAISAFTGFVVFVVGTLAGFLGDAQKLGQGFVQVSTDPSVEIQKNKFPILGNGQTWVQEIPWYNQTELETIVELTDLHLDPPTENVKLQLREKSFSLSKYDHKKSSIEISVADPGLYTLYTLKLSGRQKAAYLWGHSKPLEKMVSLEVFPALNMRKINIQMINPRTAELHGELQFGKAAPSGVSCSFWLKGVPEVGFEQYGMVYLENPAEEGDIEITDSDNVNTQNRRTEVSWTTTATPAFTRRPFTLYLKSSADKTAELWESILKQIDVKPPK